MTIGDERVNSGIGDAVIGAMEIVASVAFGRDSFRATAFAFDERPWFEGPIKRRVGGIVGRRPWDNRLVCVV